jgi:DNA replication and repair protein RecF
MPPPLLHELRLDNFRCFPTAALHPEPGTNLIIGENASGKTSLLEAIYFLGRGTSFRASRTTPLVRHGAGSASVFGLADFLGSPHRVGVQATGASVEIRIDGQPRGSRADLAEVLAVQLLDPMAHELIQGVPEGRRRFLDWGVFHVEHEFLPTWQRYRRALQQRNAALRTGQRAAALAWDEQLIQCGELVDQARQRFLAALEPRVQASADRLLGHRVSMEYWPGWAKDSSFADSLARNLDSDLNMGVTGSGPHRADLRITVDDRKARDSVSRGQEKLLVAALTVAQGQLVAAARGDRVILLVDEPAADLDRQHLAKLVTELEQSGAQLFITGLEQGVLPLSGPAAMFHVKHGQIGPPA